MSLTLTLAGGYREVDSGGCGEDAGGWRCPRASSRGMIWTSNKTQLLRNGVSLWSNTNSAAIPTVSLNLGIGDKGQYGGGSSGTGMKADWILVRNCVNPEPTW